MSVAPDLIATLAGTVAARIAAALPGLRTCRAIDGPFDVAELKRTSAAAPAVLVGTLGARQGKPGEAWELRHYHLSMAAYVVTANRGDLTAQAAALAIVQHLLAEIPEFTWTVTDVGPAEQLDWRVLVTKETRDLGVHLSVVTWSQPVVLFSPDRAQAVPITLYYSCAPEIGLAHQGDYTPAEGNP